MQLKLLECSYLLLLLELFFYYPENPVIKVQNFRKLNSLFVSVVVVSGHCLVLSKVRIYIYIGFYENV